MSLREITVGLILTTFAIWIGWDVYLSKHGGPTESMIMRDWGKVSTFFAHLMGFLCGHWFFPRQSMWLSGWMWGLLFWGVLIAWDVAWAIWFKTYPWYRYEGFWLLIGVVSGTLFWGQIHAESPIP